MTFLYALHVFSLTTQSYTDRGIVDDIRSAFIALYGVLVCTV